MTQGKDDALASIHHALGKMTMAFGRLDQELRHLLCSLISNDLGVGYIIYNAVAQSQHKKRITLIELLKHKAGVFDPFEGRDHEESEWPKGLKELVTLLKDPIQKLEDERNKYTHNVYRFVEDCGIVELCDLKSGHKNLLTGRQKYCKQVTSEEIDSLTEKINDIINKITTLSETVLTTN